MSTAWVECWKCDECGFRWIKTGVSPERCPSRACRKRSWNKDQLFVPADPTSAADVAAASEASRIARHLPKVIPAISNRLTFEETVAFVGIPKAAEVPICGKDWWEDGEHWECLMDAGHKELKHGMREMVRKLGD